MVSCSTKMIRAYAPVYYLLGIMSEPRSPHHTQDRLGSPVKEGTRVRVIEISPSVLAPLDQPEISRVQSMLGEVFSVYDVDPYGRAWVEKWWHEGEEHSTSHSLALEPQEMEVVSNNETHD
jgi:hypothetical protein